MRITNEVYTCCSECCAEANGFEDINSVFGYMLVKDDIVPYSKCRRCRGEEVEPEDYRKNIKNQQWTTAANWGRRIDISRTMFDSYLIELGYLVCDSDTRSDEIHLVITEKGRQHSATTNSTFGKVILWDYATYLEVIKILFIFAPINQ